MASVPLSPASLMSTKSPEASELSSTLTMSPTTQTYTPTNDIYRAPEYMCWLCRREIGATTERGDRGSIPRPALCRIISFSQTQDHSDNGSSSSSSPSSVVSISGIGYRLPSSTLCRGITFVIPCEQDHSIEHSPPQTTNLRLIQDPVYCPASHKWTFRVHADCWDLIESRTEPGNIQSCALSWCKALASLNWNFTPFTPGIRRYSLPKLLLTPEPRCTGKKKNAKNHGSRNRRLGMQRLDNFEDLASELGLPISREAQVIPLSRLNLNLYTLPEQTSLLFTSSGSSSSSTRDIFSTLPHEILQQIIIYTKTSDLLNFRLASRAVAYVSRLEALPRSFWLSRFLPGFELSFAMPVEVYKTRDIDWRGFYFLIREALNTTYIGIGTTEGAPSRLARRKYWWDRFAEVSTFCDDFGSLARLEGSLFSWPFSLSVDNTYHGVEDEEREQKPDSKGCVSIVAAQLTRHDGKQRYHSTVSMTLPPFSDIAGIGISMVRLCGQTYISGLRFLYRDGMVPKSLGYVFKHSETTVQLREGHIFRGFDVKFDNGAVRSLRVVYQTESGEYHQSSWVGDVNASQDNIQSTTTFIRRGECENPGTLAASFDHFRMIAIGIIEKASTRDDEYTPSQSLLAPITTLPISRKEKPARGLINVITPSSPSAPMKYSRQPPMRLQLVPNMVSQASKCK